MRKILGTLLAAVLLVSILCMPTAYADSQGTFTVSSVSAQPGEDVTLTVSISDNPGIAGLMVRMDYDDSVLTLKSLDYSGFEGTWNINGNAAGYMNTKDSDFNGVILTAVFSVSPDASESSVVSVNFSSGDICNENFDDVNPEVIPGTVSLSHQHVSDGGVISKEASCSEDGVKTFSCVSCGAVISNESIKATGHQWDVGKVAKEATCTEDGQKEFMCSRCGEKTIEKLFAKGHSFSGGKCSVCGAADPSFKGQNDNGGQSVVKDTVPTPAPDKTKTETDAKDSTKTDSAAKEAEKTDTAVKDSSQTDTAEKDSSGATAAAVRNETTNNANYSLYIIICAALAVILLVVVAIVRRKRK